MSSQALEPLGEVFTRRWVVEWMLDLAGYVPTRPLFDQRVLEPSCGTGAFLLPIVERLIESCQVHGVSIDTAQHAVTAVDLHGPSVGVARAKVHDVLRSREIDAATADRLSAKWVSRGDFLLESELTQADLVIGNPPYVRLEDVPDHLTAAYRSRWPTMNRRADLYVAFYERGLRLLTEGGTLAFICADRWMRNAYGGSLRELIHSRNFSVDVVVKLHDVDCFDSEVSAYPAITVIRRGEQGDGLVVEARKGFAPTHVAEIDLHEPVSLSGGAWTKARVPGWFDPAMWPEGSPDDLRRLAAYEKRFEPLEDVLRQTRVGIGVATGADKVFITDDDSLVEADRALPLVMTEHISDGSLKWTPKYLVNPWNSHGLVALDDYPKLATHLNNYRDRLRARYVARKQPHRWYKTIDRVHPWLKDAPKILLADMKRRMTPVVDEEGYYPHHNVYWITSQRWDLYVLAGLLLSDHAELFVKSYCVKMRGGTLRMQAQYLRRIRVPDPAALSDDQQRRLRKAYEGSDRTLATEVAAEIYD